MKTMIRFICYIGALPLSVIVVFLVISPRWPLEVVPIVEGAVGIAFGGFLVLWGIGLRRELRKVDKKLEKYL